MNFVLTKQNCDGGEIVAAYIILLCRLNGWKPLPYRTGMILPKIRGIGCTYFIIVG